MFYIQKGLRTLLNIYDETFYENSWWLLDVNYFRKKFHRRCWPDRYCASEIPVSLPNTKSYFLYIQNYISA